MVLDQVSSSRKSDRFSDHANSSHKISVLPPKPSQQSFVWFPKPVNKSCLVPVMSVLSGIENCKVYWKFHTSCKNWTCDLLVVWHSNHKATTIVCGRQRCDQYSTPHTIRFHSQTTKVPTVDLGNLVKSLAVKRDFRASTCTDSPQVLLKHLPFRCLTR